MRMKEVEMSSSGEDNLFYGHDWGWKQIPGRAVNLTLCQEHEAEEKTFDFLLREVTSIFFLHFFHPPWVNQERDLGLGF